MYQMHYQKLRVSEKPSQSEKSEGGLTKGGDSEGGDSVEASLSIIISFILKIRLYLPSTS
jgi:hypothetical protein